MDVLNIEARKPEQLQVIEEAVSACPSNSSFSRLGKVKKLWGLVLSELRSERSCCDLIAAYNIFKFGVRHCLIFYVGQRQDSVNESAGALSALGIVVGVVVAYCVCSFYFVSAWSGGGSGFGGLISKATTRRSASARRAIMDLAIQS